MNVCGFNHLFQPKQQPWECCSESQPHLSFTMFCILPWEVWGCILCVWWCVLFPHGNYDCNTHTDLFRRTLHYMNPLETYSNLNEKPVLTWKFNGLPCVDELFVLIRELRPVMWLYEEIYIPTMSWIQGRHTYTFTVL